MNIAKALETLGGYASKAELGRTSRWPEFVDMSVYYGKILRVRKGWFASVGTPEVVLRALRVGGRLACVTAAAYHRGQIAPDDPGPDEIHIVVPYGASRRRAPEGIVVHWSRRPLAGTRMVVSPEVAAWQARSCRASPPG